jgi:hypothetical protein
MNTEVIKLPMPTHRIWKLPQSSTSLAKLVPQLIVERARLLGNDGSHKDFRRYLEGPKGGRDKNGDVKDELHTLITATLEAAIGDEWVRHIPGDGKPDQRDRDAIEGFTRLVRAQVRIAHSANVEGPLATARGLKKWAFEASCFAVGAEPPPATTRLGSIRLLGDVSPAGWATIAGIKRAVSSKWLDEADLDKNGRGYIERMVGGPKGPKTSGKLLKAIYQHARALVRTCPHKESLAIKDSGAINDSACLEKPRSKGGTRAFLRSVSAGELPIMRGLRKDEPAKRTFEPYGSAQNDASSYSELLEINSRGLEWMGDPSGLGPTVPEMLQGHEGIERKFPPTGDMFSSRTRRGDVNMMEEFERRLHRKKHNLPYLGDPERKQETADSMLAIKDQIEYAQSCYHTGRLTGILHSGLEIADIETRPLLLKERGMKIRIASIFSGTCVVVAQRINTALQGLLKGHRQFYIESRKAEPEIRLGTVDQTDEEVCSADLSAASDYLRFEVTQAIWAGIVHD